MTSVEGRRSTEAEERFQQLQQLGSLGKELGWTGAGTGTEPASQQQSGRTWQWWGSLSNTGNRRRVIFSNRGKLGFRPFSSPQKDTHTHTHGRAGGQTVDCPVPWTSGLGLVEAELLTDSRRMLHHSQMGQVL